MKFNYHFNLGPHHNSSVQAIRNIKVKMKVSGMSRSEKAEQNSAIMRFITDIFKQKISGTC